MALIMSIIEGSRRFLFHASSLGVPSTRHPVPVPISRFQLCITTVMEGGGVWVEPGIVGNVPESSHDPSPNALYCQFTFLYTLQGEHQVLLATVRHSTFTPSIRVVSLIALTYIFRPRPREAVLVTPHATAIAESILSSSRRLDHVQPRARGDRTLRQPAWELMMAMGGPLASSPEALFSSRFMNAWPSRASKPDPRLDPSRNAT